jgi:hypothetical protein
MNKSIVLKAIAIIKYMIIGTTDSLFAPKMAKIIDLMTVINKPEIAVPTVNFETTY